jgi:hypothetical protein
LLLLLEEGPTGYSVQELDQAFSDRDISWEYQNQCEERFRSVILTIWQIIANPDGAAIKSSRLRNQADFYSLFGAVATLQNESQLPQVTDIISRLIDFINLIESEERRTANRAALAYFEAARSASNDAGPRKVRIEIMKSVFLDQLGQTHDRPS